MDLEESICLFLLDHLEKNHVPVQKVRILLRLLNIRKLLSSPDFDLHHCLVEVNEILQSWGFQPKKHLPDKDEWEKAKKAKFNYKKWHTEGDDLVRDAHTYRDQEKQKIDKRFSRQFKAGKAPMYPRDEEADIADWINCRCQLSFSMH